MKDRVRKRTVRRGDGEGDQSIVWVANLDKLALKFTDTNFYHYPQYIFHTNEVKNNFTQEN